MGNSEGTSPYTYQSLVPQFPKKNSFIFLLMFFLLCIFSISTEVTPSDVEQVCAHLNEVTVKNMCPKPIPASSYGPLYAQYASYWDEKMKGMCEMLSNLALLKENYANRCTLCLDAYEKAKTLAQEEQCAFIFENDGISISSTDTSLESQYEAIHTRLDENQDLSDVNKANCKAIARVLHSLCLLGDIVVEDVPIGNITDVQDNVALEPDNSYAQKSPYSKNGICEPGEKYDSVDDSPDCKFGDDICSPLEPFSSPDCKEDDGICSKGENDEKISKIPSTDCMPPLFPQELPRTKIKRPEVELRAVEQNQLRFFLSSENSEPIQILVPRFVCKFESLVETVRNKLLGKIPLDTTQGPLTVNLLSKIVTTSLKARELKQLTDVSSTGCTPYAPCLFNGEEEIEVDERHCKICMNYIKTNVFLKGNPLKSVNQCKSCTCDPSFNQETKKWEKNCNCVCTQACLQDKEAWYNDICRCTDKSSRSVAPSTGDTLKWLGQGLWRTVSFQTAWQKSLWYQATGKDIDGDYHVSSCAKHAKEKAKVEADFNKMVADLNNAAYAMDDVGKGAIVLFESLDLPIKMETDSVYQSVFRTLSGITAENKENQILPTKHNVPEDKDLVYTSTDYCTMRSGSLNECKKYCQEVGFSLDGTCHAFKETCQCFDISGKRILATVGGAALAAGVCVATVGSCAFLLTPTVMTMEFGLVAGYIGYTLIAEPRMSNAMDLSELESIAGSYDYGASELHPNPGDFSRAIRGTRMGTKVLKFFVN